MATQTENAKPKSTRAKSARAKSTRATNTQTTPDATHDAVESANEKAAVLTEKATEFNEKAAANGRKAGAAYLASCEKAVVSLADTYERTASATKLEWVADVATLQADFTREVAKAYGGAFRGSIS